MSIKIVIEGDTIEDIMASMNEYIFEHSKFAITPVKPLSVLGERIRRARISMKLNQTKFAKLCGIGVCSLGSIEGGLFTYGQSAQRDDMLDRVIDTLSRHGISVEN